MKKVNTILTNGDTIDGIVSDYYDNRDIKNDNTYKFLNYLKSINKFEQQVFLLYAENKSYRKVSKETNIGYGTVATIVNKIKNELK